MRLFSCTIWTLGALLALATLDSLPDPPAVTPRTVTCQIPPVDLDSPVSTAQPTEFVAASDVRPMFALAADVQEPNRPRDRMVLTGQLTDPSPPAWPILPS